MPALFKLLQQALTFKIVATQVTNNDLHCPRANYEPHLKRAYTSQETMNHAVQDPPQRSLNERYTGFPEPFNNDRNTTLPHPDADTSPNATIEAPENALSKTHSRHSLLRHGRHHSNGKIGSNKEGIEKAITYSGMYDNIIYADGTKDDKAAATITEDAIDIGADKEKRDEQGYKEGERKNGVLRKLALH